MLRSLFLSLVAAAALFIGSLVTTTAAFAVDPTISALCRADADPAYSRPGGYCEQIASNKSLLPTGDGQLCPAGAVPNPTPPPKCVLAPTPV